MVETRKWLVVAALVSLLVAVLLVSLHLREHRMSTSVAAASLRLRAVGAYDVFWAQIDANYYDPAFLESQEMRVLRREWREKAAAVQNEYEVFHLVLQPLTEKFPHSHVSLYLPYQAADLLAGMPDVAPEERTRLAEDLRNGPGAYTPQIRRADGVHFVVGDVIRGSPAEKAGIEPGWKVIKAELSMTNGEEAVRFSGEFLPQASAGASPIAMNFPIHSYLSPEPFESRLLEGGITYLRFDAFDDTEITTRSLAAIDAADADGLVIDLRHNRGGGTESLQQIAARLLGENVLLATKKNARGSGELRSSQGGHFTGPLVVLIGPSSFSAAEVLAAAVQDHGRGRLVGLGSNGSVLASADFLVAEGVYVQVPVDDLVRNNGRRIEAVGVEPDVAVMPTLADIRAGRDPVLERAMAELAQLRAAK